MVLFRVQHVTLGVLAGLAGWSLAEVFSSYTQPRLALALAVLAIAFFGAALVMLGEIGSRRALIAAALVATPVTALTVWASFRFERPGDFLDSGHVMMAMLLLGALPVPFLMGVAQSGRDGWRDYAALFINSWNIVVRYAAAWAFVGVVWLVLLLSSEMLQLVGLRFLQDLLREEIVIWVLTGAVLGLGLAVVSEMSDLVSPYLVLRLIRLLVPVVLVVVVVFVGVLPLRGLAQLFGHLSAAAVLMAVAAAVVSLISIVVDQNDAEAARSRIINWSALGLAILLPILAGLAAWAVAQRVVQYGWTPGRVAAGVGVAVVLGYAGLYALAALGGRRWQTRIRRANLAMALVLIAVAALWLTPVLNAEAIAVRSQMTRYAEGVTLPERLPLWEMAHDWGRAGTSAVAALRVRADAPGQEALAKRLAQLDAADSLWEYTDLAVPKDAATEEAVAARLPVLPRGATLPDGFLGDVGATLAEPILAACALRTPAGNPGCLLVRADLLPHREGDEVLLLLMDGPRRALAGVETFQKVGGFWSGRGGQVQLGGTQLSATVLIDRLIAEGVLIVPSGIGAIQLGDSRFTIGP